MLDLVKEVKLETPDKSVKEEVKPEIRTPAVDTVVDPIVSDDDRKLLDKARKSVAGLQIEIKTVIGFTSDYLDEKYQIKDQKQFDRLFGDF